MTRTGKVLVGASGFILLSLVAVVIFVSSFDWNRLKPTINQKSPPSYNGLLPFVAI